VNEADEIVFIATGQLGGTRRSRPVEGGEEPAQREERTGEIGSLGKDERNRNSEGCRGKEELYRKQDKSTALNN